MVTGPEPMDFRALVKNRVILCRTSAVPWLRIASCGARTSARASGLRHIALNLQGTDQAVTSLSVIAMPFAASDATLLVGEALRAEFSFYTQTCGHNPPGPS